MCKFCIVAFSLSYLTFALWLLVDLWVRDKAFILSVLSIKKENLDTTFIMALYTVVGALLGSGVLDLVSFHKYSALRCDFRASHVPGYFYGPWLAGTVGLIIFCLLQSGLFIFSGGIQNIKIEETSISKVSYISVGFLSGYGWMSAVDKIHEVVTRFFAKDYRERNRDLSKDASKSNAITSPTTELTSDHSDDTKDISQKPST